MIHRDLPHDKPHVCEWCGVPYHVNAYAERAGKRAPKYCSSKCKQASYRARGQATQKQAHRRQEGEQQRQRAREENFRRGWERAERGDYDGGSRPRARGTTKMDAQKAWRVLNVSPNAPIGAIKAAYRAAMKRFHPDVYHAPDATERAQEINAAYEYLKRYGH